MAFHGAAGACLVGLVGLVVALRGSVARRDFLTNRIIYDILLLAIRYLKFPVTLLHILLLFKLGDVLRGSISPALHTIRGRTPRLTFPHLRALPIPAGLVEVGEVGLGQVFGLGADRRPLHHGLGQLEGVAVSFADVWHESVCSLRMLLLSLLFSFIFLLFSRFCVQCHVLGDAATHRKTVVKYALG